MSKRRLNKQQQKRIAEKQKELTNPVDPASSELSATQCNGRVISHYGQQLEVESLRPEDRGRVIRCHQRANLPALVTGDLVQWEEGDDDLGVVVALGERRNLFSRPDTAGKAKPVAANIDLVLVVIAPLPEAFPNLIDRYLVAIENLGLEARLVLNKIDLLDRDDQEKFDNMLSIYQELGYPVSRVSALEDIGLDLLEKELRSQTTVFVGQSGVGKSSLVNRLGGARLSEVGQISEAKYKGTHKTTTARLYHLEQFDVIDSPGIREFHLEHIDPQQLLAGFRELREIAPRCRFRDCAHRSEPGCAVQQAAAEGEIAPQRLDSYFRILNTLEQSR